MSDYNRNMLLEKWGPVLDHPSLPKIDNQYRKEVTAILLENQEREVQKGAGMLFETPVNIGSTGLGAGFTGGFDAGTGTATGGVAGYDPVLISLVRRAMPQLMAYDVCGVQPMTQPTGLIFAMKSRYANSSDPLHPQNGTEALYNEADSDYSGTGTHENSDWTTGGGGRGTGMSTADAEALGTGTYLNGDSAPEFAEMAFTVERTSVVAKSRALKAVYSLELAQDLKAVHGLDAESELSNILSSEILAEINREIIRSIYYVANPGAQHGTATAGSFNLDVDANGRWSVEKFKGMLFQIEREANAIAQRTRRGRGNFVICSSDVASALAMAGVLDYAPALSTNLNVDEASTTFAGVLNGKYKVYVDPYTGGTNPGGAGTGSQYFVVGYKGPSAWDAGLFYCPYVPLQLVRAVDPGSFQPKLGFKTRYGLVSNPFVQLDGDKSNLQANTNYYFRKVKVANLL